MPKAEATPKKGSGPGTNENVIVPPWDGELLALTLKKL
jgi:hypothetical protein